MQISEATSDNLLLLDRCETIQAANGSVPQLYQLNGEFVASELKKKRWAIPGLFIFVFSVF